MQLFSRATNERLRRTAIVVFLFSAVALAVPINSESNSNDLSHHPASTSPGLVYRDIVSRTDSRFIRRSYPGFPPPTYEQALANSQPGSDTTGAMSVSSPDAVGAGTAPSSGAVGAGAASSSGAVGAGAGPSSGVVGAGPASSSSFKIVAYVTCDSTYDSSREEEPAKKALEKMLKSEPVIEEIRSRLKIQPHHRIELEVAAKFKRDNDLKRVKYIDHVEFGSVNKDYRKIDQFMINFGNRSPNVQLYAYIVKASLQDKQYEGQLWMDGGVIASPAIGSGRKAKILVTLKKGQPCFDSRCVVM
ncbi:hypothetical protein EV360DRAFT_87019 [Lentinula raphanica]|nr:hypothetical protein EV360DRAFT_87019 [Lentinula raphanica]